MKQNNQNSTSIEANKKIVLYNKTIREGNLQKITLLLERGADIDSKDARGKIALWWAAFKGGINSILD